MISDLADVLFYWALARNELVVSWSKWIVYIYCSAIYEGFNKMKVTLSALKSSSTTTMQLRHPETGKLIEAYMSGYTPDSNEWKAIQKEQADPNDKTELIIQKNQSHIELDPDAADKRRELLAAVVTDIKGFDDFKFSQQAVKELFDTPEYNWIYEQWGDWMDERKNFFAQPKKTSNSG